MGIGAGAAVAGTAAAAGGLSAGTGALIGAGVSAAGSLAGGLLQSGNTSQAAKTSQRNLELMLPQLQQNYATAQNQLSPLVTAGTEGTQATTDLLGLNGPDAAAAAMARYQTNPGYQWQMQQGLRGVDAGAAARGMLRSGATLKAEDTFAQGLANSDFGQYYNRLANLSSLGDTAIGQQITAGQDLAADMQGNATSQNAVATNAANAQNSIIGSAAGGLGSSVNGLFNNPNVLSTINSWLAPGTPAPNYMTGTTNQPGTSPGYGSQLFSSGGVF